MAVAFSDSHYHQQQQQQVCGDGEEEAMEEMKQQLGLPYGFHEILTNVARAVIQQQPKELLLYCAQLLEAEMDRRSIHNIAYCTLLYIHYTMEF